MDTFGTVLIGAAMVVGTFGTVVPVLPGLPIVWGAALLYALLSNPDATGWAAFALITLIAMAGLVVGTVLPHRRVVAAGVPRSSVVAGIVTGIVGFFAIPVIGLPIGAAGGIFLAENLRLKDPKAALKATRELIVGFGVGALVQFAAGIAMIVTWVVWAITG